jgi:endonuclease/exonuclease/phosphatase family metal-dependent hydrolase
VRVLTLNALAPQYGDWPRRRSALRRGLRDLDPDVVALQEVVDVEDLLGSGWHVAPHTRRGPDGDGAVLASRWPLAEVHEIDHLLTPRAGEFPWGGTVAVEVLAPEPVLVVHHKPVYQLGYERERELHAVAAARLVDELAPDPARHVVLLGDFDARPDSASLRFWTGRQSLDGTSVCYHDAWESRHGDDPGHTFALDNPLVREGGMHLVRGRRIDYVLVRGGSHGPTLQADACERVLVEPVDGVQASDHYGVLAELSVPGRPPGTSAYGAGTNSRSR